MSWGKEKLKLEQCWRTCFSEYMLLGDKHNKIKLIEKLSVFSFSEDEINDYIYLYDDFNLNPALLLNKIEVTH